MSDNQMRPNISVMSLQVTDGMYSAVKEQGPKVGLLIDFDSEPTAFDNQQCYDNQNSDVMYDNSKNEQGL